MLHYGVIISKTSEKNKFPFKITQFMNTYIHNFCDSMIYNICIVYALPIPAKSIFLFILKTNFGNFSQKPVRREKKNTRKGNFRLEEHFHKNIPGSPSPTVPLKCSGAFFLPIFEIFKISSLHPPPGGVGWVYISPPP